MVTCSPAWCAPWGLWRVSAREQVCSIALIADTCPERALMAYFFRATIPALSLSISPLLSLVFLVQVVCRVRPPVSRETHGARTLSLANRCVAVAGDKRTVTLNSKPEKNFTFDYAAGEDSTQEELFAEVGLRTYIFFCATDVACFCTIQNLHLHYRRGCVKPLFGERHTAQQSLLALL